jgi:Zn-dependent alcohol dehydrogenase
MVNGWQLLTERLIKPHKDKLRCTVVCFLGCTVINAFGVFNGFDTPNLTTFLFFGVGLSVFKQALNSEVTQKVLNDLSHRFK